MVKHKKGQAGNYAVAFMLAVCLILLGLALAPSVNQITTQSMNSTNMDCDNSSISDFTKAGCITADIGQAYFIGGLIALAGLIIAARIIFQ